MNWCTTVNVCWQGYTPEEDQCIDAKNISSEILLDFRAKASLDNTCKRCHTYNVKPSRYQRGKILAVIQNMQDRVINLPAEEEEITTNANNISLQIFNLSLQY